MGRDILNCTSLALSLASGMSSPDLLFRCSLYKDESDVESRERVVCSMPFLLSLCPAHYPARRTRLRDTLCVAADLFGKNCRERINKISKKGGKKQSSFSGFGR